MKPSNKKNKNKKNNKKKKDNKWNVARYLATRLEQLGIKYVFGVPGNHLGPFLSIMQEKTSLRWRGNTNEINGGYAADGYARAKGISAVGVTYGVGALSLINTVGGAFVERVPMIVINAAPTYEQYLNFISLGLLTSHMSPQKQSNLDVYRQVTVDAQRITNSRLAPIQIDSAITMALTEQKPVYIEVFQDVWEGGCDPTPAVHLQPRPRDVNKANVKKSVEATIELIEKFGDPIFWGGMEIDRAHLQDDFEALIDATGIPYCTSIMGKSIISERHPRFHGIYNGNASPKETYRIFNCEAKCRIGLGAWTTSKNLGGTQAMGDDWVTASHNGVRVGTEYFPNVNLGAFIRLLKDRLVEKKKEASQFSIFGELDYYRMYAEKVKASKKEKNASLQGDLPTDRNHFLELLFGKSEKKKQHLTYDGFFKRINKFISDQDKRDESESERVIYKNPYGVVADAGFSLLGSQNIRMAERHSYFSQTSWLSIGYSVGAVTGLKTGFSEKKATEKRMMVFVGDGSFQETAQALSSHTRHRQNNIVFIMNNENFYGIEQMLVEPKYYSEECPVEADFYNELHPWEYAKLATVFHTKDKPMHGHVIKNYEELDRLLEKLKDDKDPINQGPNLVQLLLKKEDYPSSIQYKVDGACPDSPHRNPCEDWKKD